MIDIDSRELNRWINDEGKKQQATAKFIERSTLAAEKLLKGKALTISVSSKLHNSISSDVSYIRMTGSVISRASYVYIALEDGRRPGSAPPYKALERWAARKLGDKRAAFAAARKIATEGTEKYKSGGPKMITDTEKFMDRLYLPKAMRDLADELVK